jgi:hypothetical protein
MKKLLTLLVCSLMIMMTGVSQDNNQKPIVIKANYFGVSAPLRDMMQVSSKADMTWKEGIVKNMTNLYSNNTDEDVPAFENPIRQYTNGQVLTDTTLQNFEGVNMSGYLPPDTDGDVGPDHYFQVTNCRFAIYNKTGTKLMGPSNNTVIFTGLPHNNNDGDAIVLYDENADRWLFSQFSLPNFPAGPFYENVAISKTPDPTGDYYLYQFTFSDMPDYPKLSVWGDGYYMTVRRFAANSLSWLGPAVVAMDRSKMLNGDPAPTMVMFNLPSSCEGPLSADCDSDFPPDTTPCPVVYLNSGNSANIKINSFHVDWTNTASSTLTLAATVPISALSVWPGQSIVVPQKGTSQKLDVMSGKRVMFRMPFRKFNDHWSMLMTTTEKLTNAQAGIRWMEVRNTGSGWTLYQEGTYAPDATNHRWMGSIAMDSVGNIAMGYSISSSSLYPSIRYTGRMNGDPLGVMTIAERGIWNGTGSQSDPSGRWGDYSAMNADPTDLSKFWYTQEYVVGGSWKTRIASFSFAGILSVDAYATPSTICASGDTVQLNVVAAGGSGTYTYSWTSDPPGFTSDLQSPLAFPTETTKYIIEVNDGTQTKTDTALVTLLPVPTVFAGNDTSHCWYEHFFPIFGTATDYSALQWKTSGDGTFSYPQQLMTFYYPGDLDRANGSMILSLTAYSLTPCNDSITDDMEVLLGCVGLNDLQNDRFTVSLKPNPNKGQFFVNVTGVKDQLVNISVLDIQGKTVYQDAVKSSSQALAKEIDLSGIGKGTYVVKVQTEKDLKVDKIIIQ